MNGPHIPQTGYTNRRANEYHYSTPPHHQQPHHNPYSTYHHHPQYHGPPQMHHHYPQQWYQPYPQYAPPSPLRVYHQQSPLVVSSHPYAHPVVPVSRQPVQTPQALPSSIPEQSASSTTSQTIPSPSPTPTSTSISTSTPPVQAPKPTTPPMQAPKPSTPPVQAPKPSTPTSTTQSVQSQPPPPPTQISSSAPSTQRMPFYPQLPWLSVPGSSFPSKSIRRRRRRITSTISSNLVQLPSRQQPKAAASEHPESNAAIVPATPDVAVSKVETTPTPVIQPDADATTPTTPSLDVPSQLTSALPAASTHKRTPTRPIVPIVPIRSVFPVSSSTQSIQQKVAVPSPSIETAPAAPSASEVVDGTVSPPTIERTSVSSPAPEPAAPAPDPAAAAPDPASAVPGPAAPTPDPAEPASDPAAPASVPAAPKSWAELLRSKAASANAVGATPSSVVAPVTNGVATTKAGTVADALRLYTVESDAKLSFLEPRGLVNTGNMCYMNSILQILVFCVPFYDFLDQVGRRAVHSFKSDTPLVEAMIMFMREFPVIDSASSAEKLRMRLKDNELEQYGESFIPEYVYDVIKALPRFSSMRRGHQQDAEEFLGFLLEGLHDECANVMKKANGEVPPSGLSDIAPPPISDTSVAPDKLANGGWLEVGPKQKAAITRSSGAIVTESPITKIFGGKLRSEFRVPGLQNSVTQEPYQPLQLDIGDPNIHNITDALKGLTRSETLYGDFKSPRGPSTSATKQVFIETLPPVLILHLKRFQYDNTGGTQKIWKKIGYPLELEIPKEVFPANKRGAYAAQPGGLPKFRLIGVVYHHGKNASGGHYTVDVRRQEGREWIRLDDTFIRRVRSDDVAGEGGEEDPKTLVKALEQHTRDQDAGRNIYEAAGFDDDTNNDDEEDRGGWSQVNGHTTSPSAGTTTKKWSGIVNGAGSATPTTTGKQTPRDGVKYTAKDNKVAYILFYEKL